MRHVDIYRDALVRQFFEESETGLAAMEQALVTLEESLRDARSLNTLFRVAHATKGNSASLGFAELAEVAQVLEDVLDRLRSGSLVVSRQVIDLLRESVYALRALLAEAKQ